MVWGARQVGKTFLLRDQFAETYYPNQYVYIDFRLEKSIRDYCMEAVNPEDIIRFLSVEKNVSITHPFQLSVQFPDIIRFFHTLYQIRTPRRYRYSSNGNTASRSFSAKQKYR